MKSQSLSLLVLLAYQYTSLMFANYRYTLHCVFCLVSVKQPTSTHREPFFHRWSQWAQCYVGRVFSENRLGRRKLILILVKSTPPPQRVRNNELYGWRNTIKCYLIFSRRDLQHDAVPLYEGWPAFVLGVQGVPLAEYHWGLYRTAGLSGEHHTGKLSGNTTVVYTILTISELEIQSHVCIHVV